MEGLKRFEVVDFCIVALILTAFVEGSCKISEKMVVLKRGNVHEVPICNPIIRYANGEEVEQPGPMQFNRFKCIKSAVCEVCRCDRARGYKMASADPNAPCVMYCPVTKLSARRCVRLGMATVCNE